MIIIIDFEDSFAYFCLTIWCHRFCCQWDFFSHCVCLNQLMVGGVSATSHCQQFGLYLVSIDTLDILCPGLRTFSRLLLYPSILSGDMD